MSFARDVKLEVPCMVIYLARYTNFTVLSKGAEETRTLEDPGSSSVKCDNIQKWGMHLSIQKQKEKSLGWLICLTKLELLKTTNCNLNDIALIIKSIYLILMTKNGFDNQWRKSIFSLISQLSEAYFLLKPQDSKHQYVSLN